MRYLLPWRIKISVSDLIEMRIIRGLRRTVVIGLIKWREGANSRERQPLLWARRLRVQRLSLGRLADRERARDWDLRRPGSKWAGQGAEQSCSSMRSCYILTRCVDLDMQGELRIHPSEMLGKSAGVNPEPIKSAYGVRIFVLTIATLKKIEK